MACAYCRQAGHNSSTCQNPNGAAPGRAGTSGEYTITVSPGTSGTYTITATDTGTIVSVGDTTVARFRQHRDGALTPVDINENG